MDIIIRLRSAVCNDENDGQLLDDAAEEIELLRSQMDPLLKGEFICKKCGIRKDGEHENKHEF